MCEVPPKYGSYSKGVNSTMNKRKKPTGTSTHRFLLLTADIMGLAASSFCCHAFIPGRDYTLHLCTNMKLLP